MSCDLGISVSCPLLYWALQGYLHEIKFKFQWGMKTGDQSHPKKLTKLTLTLTLRLETGDLSLLALHLNYNLVANDESSMESDFGPTESNRKLGSCKGKIDHNFRRSQKVKTKNKSSCEMATGIFI